MSKQPSIIKKPQAILFTFTTTELNVLRLIANHWQKMYVCHEIDRGDAPGMTFYCVWSPLFTIDKLQSQPTFKTDTITQDRYDVGDIGAQVEFPLCAWELDMLSCMTSHAVEGRLNRFLLTDKGVMTDVIGPYLTQSWTCNAAAVSIAEKLSLLSLVAGLFEGHSGYELAVRQLKRMNGVEIEHA